MIAFGRLTSRADNNTDSNSLSKTGSIINKYGIIAFIEGDIFRAVVPLSEITTGRVGPYDNTAAHDNLQDSPQVDNQENIIIFCTVPRLKAEIVNH